MSVVAEALAIASERLDDEAVTVLARLGGPLGHAARAAAKSLVKADIGVRKRRRAEIVVATRAPLPEGFRAVHASWIEEALAPLPARARTAVASASTDRADVWLARWATAAIPPLPADDTRTASELVEWLTGVGADQIAFALGPEQAAKQPHLAKAAARITKPPRAGQLGPQRAAIERCRDIVLTDELALVRVASRALATHLWADQLALLQLTRRLPRAIGIVVEREVAAHRATSFDQCPAWAAVIAQ